MTEPTTNRDFAVDYYHLCQNYPENGILVSIGRPVEGQDD